MNNFEERKFLNYLEKLLPYTDTNDYNFDNVFDFFCDEFKVDRKPYPIDKDNSPAILTGPCFMLYDKNKIPPLYFN